MKLTKPSIAMALLMLAGQSSAQDKAVQLPEICTAGAAATVPGMDGGMDHGSHSMDAGHTALIAGMDLMNANMAQGMMAEDLDVAFVCSMIPHHQGAIDMARAELEHGDNPWAKEMAQKVIDAQEQEIADMIAWLAEEAE